MLLFGYIRWRCDDDEAVCVKKKGHLPIMKQNVCNRDNKHNIGKNKFEFEFAVVPWRIHASYISSLIKNEINYHPRNIK